MTSSRRQLAHFMPIAKLKQVFSAKRHWKEDLAHHKCVVDQGHAVSSETAHSSPVFRVPRRAFRPPQGVGRTAGVGFNMC